MVKPYARDYYLPWPDNPALGAVPDRTKWLEYDVHGQYFGWGIFPLPVVTDELARFRSASAAGCSVVQLRIDWERINALWALDTFGQVNLATAVQAARDTDADADALLAAALRTTGVVSADVGARELEQLAALWLELYPIALRVLYVAGNVYNTSSMIPNGVAQGWSYMHMLGGMRGWDGPQIGSLEVADPLVVADLLAEKADALADYVAWDRRMREWQASGALRLPDPSGVGDVLEWSSLYVRAFVASAEIVVLVKAAETRDLTQAEDEALRRSVERLADVRTTTQKRDARNGYRHYARLLVDPGHLTLMIDKARSTLATHLVN
ncbi:hypothetical protein E1269_23530 [Jiangella asiatica]|uniref:Uncharacterized protein n=2 Tax=Jiangella asiatica TaxID=2530372 RepID=A0A4V2Z0I2_9ACTN|nr:hypothetical protein E1269_23530 [Jiangella asiatica]